jgi:sporulation protein YlmC with PRC-barrel domain
VPAAFALAVIGAWMSAAVAQEPARTQAGGEAQVTVAHVLRTADIVGLPVRNKAGENLGKIDDLVIDMKHGEVRYAALSFGGIAGIGAKLFAVPWEALTFKFGAPGDISARHVMFETTKDQLDKAPGFDSSHWPNVADPQWAASIDKHFKIERRHEPGQDARVTFETVFRASKIKGMDVRNDANENLGSVDELVLDVTKGHVKYIALSHGSAFTGGHKLFAVPLSHCTLAHANDKTFIKLNVSQDTLKNAPGFDKNRWPDMANPNWSKEIDTYYERTAQRTTPR